MKTRHAALVAGLVLAAAPPARASIVYSLDYTPSNSSSSMYLNYSFPDYISSTVNEGFHNKSDLSHCYFERGCTSVTFKPDYYTEKGTFDEIEVKYFSVDGGKKIDDASFFFPNDAFTKSGTYQAIHPLERFAL